MTEQKRTPREIATQISDTDVRYRTMLDRDLLVNKIEHAIAAERAETDRWKEFCKNRVYDDSLQKELDQLRTECKIMAAAANAALEALWNYAAKPQAKALETALASCLLASMLLEEKKND